MSRLDQLEVLVGAGLRLEDLEDVPLVLGLGRVLDLDHVHLLQELVVPVAELAGTAFEDVELGAASRYSTIAMLSVPPVSPIALSRIWVPTYSPQAWFSGGLPLRSMNFCVNACDASLSSPWYQRLCQWPESDSRPAAQNGPVSMTPPASG